MTDKTAKDIMIALRYCTSDDGAFCEMCPYGNCGVKCSKFLLLDASDMIKSLMADKEDIRE